MGIQGLWPILEPTAEPVTLESLEGKRFAIDVSLWLYQALYGYGAYQQHVRCPHLSLLLNRLSKLLFYKIKPVFVFDGPNVPLFKRKILRERQMKRFMEEMKVTKAQKRALAEMALSQNADDEHSQEKWKSAFGLASKRKTEEEKMFEMAPVCSTNSTHMKRERNDSDEPEVLYSSVEGVPSTQTDEEIMASLVSRDERLDYLLNLRERERSMRLTEDQVPEDSRAFCNFQIERLLKRNRVNEQLDMLKKEALGQALWENKPKDSGGGNVLLTVMEGLTRGHFITRDDNDVMVDEERTVKEQKIKESISWPVMIEQMRNEAQQEAETSGGTSLLKGVASNKGKPMKSEKETTESDNDEDEALQEAIAMSLREMNSQGVAHVVNDSFGCESKGDVIERLRNAFAARNRDLQRDTWSESEHSSSSSDEFIDVHEPCTSFPEANSLSASDSAAVDLSEPSHENEEEWMPNYINEFDDKRRAEQESRRAKTEAELEREQEGVYKECQELLRLCGIPFVVSPGEAEAQCCELERLGLVQGIVSDDSDVWLFGASTVYKNMFNLKRRVQKYSSRTIHEQLGLTRWETIEIALLSGGDYTPGLENVGVVTALELISEFAVPTKDGDDKEVEVGLKTLRSTPLRQWLASGNCEDMRMNSTTSPPNVSLGSNIVISSAFALLQRISDWLNGRQEGNRSNEEQSSANIDESSPPMRKKLKRENGEKRYETARRLRLRETVERNNDEEVIQAFPSREIFEAYSRPLVDSSTEKPVWRTVNEKELEIFVWQRLGWDEERLRKQTQGSLRKWNEYMSRCEGGGGIAYQTHITSFLYRLHKSEDDQRLAPTARVLRALRRLAAAKKEQPDPSVSLICKASFVEEPSDSSNLSGSFEVTDMSFQQVPISFDDESSSSRSCSTTSSRRPAKRVIEEIKEPKSSVQSPVDGAARNKARASSKNIKRPAASSKRRRGAKKARSTNEGLRKRNDEQLDLSEESTDEG